MKKNKQKKAKKRQDKFRKQKAFARSQKKNVEKEEVNEYVAMEKDTEDQRLKKTQVDKLTALSKDESASMKSTLNEVLNLSVKSTKTATEMFQKHKDKVSKERDLIMNPRLPQVEKPVGVDISTNMEE